MSSASPPQTGNNSTDFQPTTQNPQTNVAQNLQQTTTELQPVASGSGLGADQIYQQANTNPNLKVVTTGQPLPAPPKTSMPNHHLLIWLSGLTLILALISYFLSRSRRKNDVPATPNSVYHQPTSTEAEPIMSVPEPTYQASVELPSSDDRTIKIPVETVPEVSPASPVSPPKGPAAKKRQPKRRKNPKNAGKLRPYKGTIE